MAKKLLPGIQQVFTQKIETALTKSKAVQLHVLRLDAIHPVVSGNKLFKLHYYLKQALQEPRKTLVTFGGAYSNHLSATAFACNQLNIQSVGIVRGQAPAKPSYTLDQCQALGMQLHYISRGQYCKKDNAVFIQGIYQQYGDIIIVPEGGFAPDGAKGAALIADYISDTCTHVCCAVGTATTIAGLLSAGNQQVIAIPVLKGMNDVEERIVQLTKNDSLLSRLTIKPDYHFGGYARKSPALLNFMNSLYVEHQLPTDFVYTGKMMFAVFNLIENNFFPPGSCITAIHTGGLQGNLSLPAGSLTF